MYTSRLLYHPYCFLAQLLTICLVLKHRLAQSLSYASIPLHPLGHLHGLCADGVNRFTLVVHYSTSIVGAMNGLAQIDVSSMMEILRLRWLFWVILNCIVNHSSSLISFVFSMTVFRICVLLVLCVYGK